jgi:hypothetical protein
LDPDKDPDQIPELQLLSDAEFEKAAQKLNAERDVFAFSSILSLNYYLHIAKKPKKQPEFLTHILKYIMDKADAHYKNPQFKQLLTTKNIGLLMCERYLNLPPDVVPHMHSEFPEDLQWTKQQDDISDPKEFDYQYVLVITRYTVPTKRAQDNEKYFYHCEDKFLWAKAEHSFSFLTTFRYVDDDGNKQSVSGAQGGAETQYKLVYLLPWKDYCKLSA